MNLVSEQDLEMLEEYLDEELSIDAIEQLRARLNSEPLLAAALEEVRNDRKIRSAAWSAMEPSETQTQQFAARVGRAARHQQKWVRIGRFSRFGGAAAACILVGFFAGWLGRDKGPNAIPLGGTNMNQVSAGLSVTEPRPVLPGGSPGVLISEIRVSDAQGRTAPMLLVRGVTADSAASGLREGDLLLSVDGQDVPDNASLANVLSRGAGTHAFRILRSQHVIELNTRLQQ